jgi:transcriptional regulator with XRE-family HTH domain
MPPQQRATFGTALRAALRQARRHQSELARELAIDPSQVNRWARDKALPHATYVARIDAFLGSDLAGILPELTPEYELFVSAPIMGVGRDAIAGHHDDVARVVEAARQHVNGLYWPGEDVRSIDDLVAPDIATARKFRALVGCQAYLYVQFAEMVYPSSALVEFGFALGRRIKTTVIVLGGLASPFMLDGFAGVANGLKFLPDARVYTVPSVSHAVGLVERSGREMLGLM